MKVKIFVPTSNAMQSGRNNVQKWHMEFDKEDSRYIEDVMGWTSNIDMKNELGMTFNSKMEAIEFAKQELYDYEVIEPKKPNFNIQSYADNFTD